MVLQLIGTIYSNRAIQSKARLESEEGKGRREAYLLRNGHVVRNEKFAPAFNKRLPVVVPYIA